MSSLFKTNILTQPDPNNLFSGLESLPPLEGEGQACIKTDADGAEYVETANLWDLQPAQIDVGKTGITDIETTDQGILSLLDSLLEDLPETTWSNNLETPRLWKEPEPYSPGTDGPSLIPQAPDMREYSPTSPSSYPSPPTWTTPPHLPNTPPSWTTPQLLSNTPPSRAASPCPRNSSPASPSPTPQAVEIETDRDPGLPQASIPGISDQENILDPPISNLNFTRSDFMSIYKILENLPDIPLNEDYTVTVKNRQRNVLFPPGHTLYPYNEQLIYFLSLYTQSYIDDKPKATHFNCIACKTKNMDFVVARKHVIVEHGHLFNYPRSEKSTLSRIPDIQQLKLTDDNVKLYCHICHEKLTTAIDYIIHYSCFHSSVDSKMLCCPFCYLPLFKKSIFSHFKLRHSYVCCNSRITCLKTHISHLLNNIHFHENAGSISKLNTLYKMTRSRLPNIYWLPTLPILYFPKSVNPTVPQLYSLEFYQLIESFVYKKDSIYNNLDMETYVRDLNVYVQERWGAFRNEYSGVRDAMVLGKVAEFVRELWLSPGIPTFSGYIREVNLISKQISCNICQDTLNHASSPSECLSPKLVQSISHSNHVPSILHEKVKNWDDIASIWISDAGSPLGRSPYNSKFPCLNLSYTKTLSFPVNYSYGRVRAYNKDGVLTTKFSDLQHYIDTICCTLPKNFCGPIFVEYPRVELFSIHDISLQVIAFLSMIQSLKEKHDFCFVILGPHPTIFESDHLYSKSKNEAVVVNNVLSLTAAISNITVLPMMGTVFIQEKYPGIGIEFPMSKQETFLINGNGTTSRIFSYKLSTLYEKFMTMYGEVIINSAFKKIYNQNKRGCEKHFHFDFEKHVNM